MSEIISIRTLSINKQQTGRRRPARGSLKQNVKWTSALALPMKAVQLTIGLWIVGASWAFQLGPRRVHVGRNYRHPFSAAANNNALEGIGAPSNPGWESGRLNRLTEWADSSAPNRPIICEYDPKGRWLWRKWRGTVLKATWGSVVTIMLAGLALDFVARGYRLPYPLSWDIVAIPGESTPFIKRLAAVTKVWEYQLSLSVSQFVHCDDTSCVCKSNKRRWRVMMCAISDELPINVCSNR